VRGGIPADVSGGRDLEDGKMRKKKEVRGKISKNGK
jgi:hypothetical protein